LLYEYGDTKKHINRHLNMTAERKIILSTDDETTVHHILDLWKHKGRAQDWTLCATVLVGHLRKIGALRDGVANDK